MNDGRPIRGWGVWVLGGCLAWMSGCSGGPSDSGAGGPCILEATLGTGDRDTFVPLSEGDPVEVWLGFQGLRMLILAVRLEGVQGERADLTMHLTVESTDVHLHQVDREVRLVSEGDSSSWVVEEYLIFLNDAPASFLIGHMAHLEHIAQVAGCTAVTQVEVELRDDHTCVDTTVVVPDAGVDDGGLPDGAVPCEDDT